MLNDWSHKVRAILKKYCPGNIKRILPSSQSASNTRFYFGHQKLCMDNNIIYHHNFYSRLNTCVSVSCLRFDVHFISLKLFTILLLDLVWGYIRHVSIYTIQCRITYSHFFSRIMVQFTCVHV